MKKIYFLFSVLILLVNLTFSQNERIAALGNPLIALKDFDLDLNLYDFGENIAGLFLDRNFDVLVIRPKFFATSGNYKRYFDYEKSNVYMLSFDGTKILKEGTFRGYVTYEIESRKNVNKALNRYPYIGIPFFLTDTTTGDFIYNGPRVGFQYSFEFLKNFYMGFELNYQLVDGLKSIYSRAKSLWRNIDGSYNLIYNFNNNFLIGAKIALLDKKESIEAKSEDLFDAEIFNYRGDTYAFKRRSQTVSQTYREKSTSYSIQMSFSLFEKIKVGLKSEYLNSNFKTQYPYGMLKEYEEGHSVFEDFSFSAKAHYSPLENLLIGFEGNYKNYNSWSRISELVLMIWKWDLKNYNVGSGFSYRIKSFPLLLITEFTVGKLISDSSKYIDNKFVKHDELYYSIKAGFEYEIFNRFFLRGGYESGVLGFDPNLGGKNVSLNKISFGFGLYLFKSMEIDYFVDYALQKNEMHKSNKYLNTQVCLKLFNY